MAGYTRIYCLGGEGGYQGADGVNPIQMQIWLGEGGRQWLEAHWFGLEPRPLGQLRVLVPAAPDHPDMLLDACLAFMPDFFQACPSLEAVRGQLGAKETLDLHLGDDVPALWSRLREEARPVFAALPMWEGRLQRLG